MDKIPGTSSGILQNNLTIQSNSNELIGDFNIKTIEITKEMQDLHFSMTDLRNKLSKVHINNNYPIIAQVMGNKTTITTSQVRVEIYPPAQSCWERLEDFCTRN